MQNKCNRDGLILHFVVQRGQGKISKEGKLEFSSLSLFLKEKKKKLQNKFLHINFMKNIDSKNLWWYIYFRIGVGDMDIDYYLIGQRIKEARKNKGYTQEKLAEEIDIAVTYLSRFEKGHPINLKRLAQISQVLDVSMEYLLSGTVPKSDNYLNKDFEEILETCSPEKLKLIYNIAKTIVDQPEEEFIGADISDEETSDKKDEKQKKKYNDINGFCFVEKLKK